MRFPVYYNADKKDIQSRVPSVLAVLLPKPEGVFLKTMDATPSDQLYTDAVLLY